jgi:hypothetical protein
MSFLQNEARQISIRWILPRIFIIATLLSYLWEIAQSSLYEGGGDISRDWWHCLLASFGDSLLMILIFAIGLIVFRRRDWFARPGSPEYVFMLIMGLTIGAGFEIVSINTGIWSYTPQMPLMPMLGVGIAPIFLMLLIPPIVFRAVALCFIGICNRRGKLCQEQR